MNFLLFWLRRYKYKLNSRSQSNQGKKQGYSDEAKVSPHLAANLEELHSRFYETPDLVVRQFYSNQLKRQVALCYLEGLTNIVVLNDNILHPLMFADSKGDEALVNIGYVSLITQWAQLEKALLDGFSVLLKDGHPKFTVFNTQGWVERAIVDPQLEVSAQRLPSRLYLKQEARILP